jgi:hypothetical protein
MTTETLLLEINEQVLNGELGGLEENTRLLVKQTSELEANQKLAEVLYRNYSQYKSSYLAKVLETIIRINPRLALVDHPNNFLFKAAIITGSVEMYECYIEEAVQPFHW